MRPRIEENRKSVYTCRGKYEYLDHVNDNNFVHFSIWRRVIKMKRVYGLGRCFRWYWVIAIYKSSGSSGNRVPVVFWMFPVQLAF